MIEITAAEWAAEPKTAADVWERARETARRRNSLPRPKLKLKPPPPAQAPPPIMTGGDLLRREALRSIKGPDSIKRILAEVADAHGLTIFELISQRRMRPIVHARQFAMWRMSRETPLSLMQIGRSLGRDHTTVLHAIKMVNHRLLRRSAANS